ncbi:hypothetical protein DPMN_168549 [Dreissena polymorpha]|uniref:B box-type domain-containing protein n=2 Tax=Dreissena polymorpha TaxID=45954 RepID=A0A9D4F2V4_DREPO|nr:hypothetical protein DPMN_168549 [Dreissena polymorpha]
MRNWPVSKELEAVLLMCEIHTHKQLETFCKDHSQLCCSKCVSLSHRKCQKKTLTSAKKQITLTSAKKKAADVQELIEKLLINMRKLRKLQSCCESEIEDLTSSYQGQEHIVHKMNDKIKSTIDKIVRRTFKKTPKVEQNKKKIHELMHSRLFDIENITLSEANITLLSLQTSLKTGVESCIRHHRELKAVHELLLYSSDNNNKKLCFIAGRKCIDKIQQVESYLDENSVKLECAVLNQTIQGTEQYLSKLSGLVKLLKSMNANTDIELYLSKLSGLVRVVCPNHVFTVQGKSEHSVRIQSDTATCYITVICVLPNKQVLVADYYNKKVKLLNQQYHVLSHWVVTSYIYDMCQITPREVAVALHGNNSNIHEVQFITVNQSQLAPGRKLELLHNCWGIAHHQGELFVSSGTALFKYSLSGKLVCRLYKDISGCTVYKCAVSQTGDKLYITNQEQNKLLTLARNGTLLATLTDPALEVPYGLHVMPAGQVLVCGWLSNTILQVDREGRRTLGILGTEKRDGVGHPMSVSYSSTTSSIIVGQYGGILVFRVE